MERPQHSQELLSAGISTSRKLFSLIPLEMYVYKRIEFFVLAEIMPSPLSIHKFFIKFVSSTYLLDPVKISYTHFKCFFINSAINKSIVLRLPIPEMGFAP